MDTTGQDSRLFSVLDKTSSPTYLVDTGAEVSVLHASADDAQEPVSQA